MSASEQSPPIRTATGEDAERGEDLLELDNVEWLRDAVMKLYDILDDISTADDAFRENDRGFRKYVMARQLRKNKLITSDGYHLFRVKG